MATKIIMPKQGLQMTEGTILRWFYEEGDKVREGEPLFEIETDKLTIEIESVASGTLLKIVKDVDEVVPITETVAIVGEPGEDYSDLLKETDNASKQQVTAVEPSQATTSANMAAAPTVQRTPGERIFITPRAKMRAEEKEIDYALVGGSGPEGLIIERDILQAEATIPKVKATPVATRIAQAAGIDLETIQGSGVSGRILKDDLLQLETATTAQESAVNRGETFVELKGMRKIISKRMMESLQTMAQANHTVTVDMTEAIHLRTQLKEENIKVSYNDILVLAVSKALGEHPYMNASMAEDGIILKNYVNMGLAVAVGDGLIVPNIKNADLMTLQEIAQASATIIDKALSNKLLPDDYNGGTFTITNLGMYDIDEFTAIINAPESGILAVGKIEETPVVRNGDIVVRPLMKLRLTYDHRIIDGAPAADFLRRIKTLLQKPYLLL